MTQNENKKTDEKMLPALIAYHVPDREKAPWTRIGAAWDHKDGKGDDGEEIAHRIRTSTFGSLSPKRA